MTTLLVASAGGHLQELHRLRPRLRGVDADVTWITFDTAQSRSLLAGEDVVYVPYCKPRDAGVALRNAAIARRLLRGHRFSHAVSTGSAVAVSFLPLARLHGASCHYIESAARIAGPSVTGRMLRAVPGIHLYTQNRDWLRPPWRYGGSVFDGFAPEPAGVVAPRVERVVVAVGSAASYGFRELLERVAAVVPRDAEVFWQTGSTDVAGMGIHGRASVPSGDLCEAMAHADVVVAHAGVGTCLIALEAGRWPIIVPRRRSRKEHIDDHQVQIAVELSRRDLALAREVGDLTAADLVRAAARRVHEPDSPGAFELVGA